MLNGVTKLRASSATTAIVALLVGSSVAGIAAEPATAQLDCPAPPGPDQFVKTIDNPYFPLQPGTTYVYRERVEGKELDVVVEVTREKKTILGVETTVVRDDVADKNGQFVERTLDWFAQDKVGNVWYFGEQTQEYQNGQVVSTAGSFEAGKDGARAGIIMEAHPRRGDVYRQECAPGVAEDTAKVLRLNASAKVPFGTFDETLQTRDSNPLDPGAVERKEYARCVGLVYAVAIKNGKVRPDAEELELIAVKGGKPAADCRTGSRSGNGNGNGNGNGKPKGKGDDGKGGNGRGDGGRGDQGHDRRSAAPPASTRRGASRRRRAN